MRDEAAEWFESSTSRAEQWPVGELLVAKGSTTVSVVIPARNEAPTIAGIVRGIRQQLMDDVALVDELVVMDSDSTDDTARLAREQGAVVHAVREVRPELGGFAGKGEALWKAQFVTRGDVLVFIDADLTQWGTHFVSGLLGPLLCAPEIALVKGFYDRVLDDGSRQHSPQGGRVTELVARPLINLHWPQLAAVVQPLAGEWAVRRSAFETLPVPVGYGIELAVLLDTFARAGLQAIAQVDLGERAHSHQSVHDLGVMAAELLTVAGRRLGAVEPVSAELWQFDRHVQPRWRARAVPTSERPPAISIPRGPDAQAR